MANKLLEAHHAARVAREAGTDALDAVTVSRIRDYYHGALARGADDNRARADGVA